VEPLQVIARYRLVLDVDVDHDEPGAAGAAPGSLRAVDRGPDQDLAAAAAGGVVAAVQVDLARNRYRAPQGQRARAVVAQLAIRLDCERAGGEIVVGSWSASGAMFSDPFTVRSLSIARYVVLLICRLLSAAVPVLMSASPRRR